MPLLTYCFKYLLITEFSVDAICFILRNENSDAGNI